MAGDNDWLMEEGWALFLVCLYILRLQIVGLIFPHSKGPILSDVGSKDLEESAMAASVGGGGWGSITSGGRGEREDSLVSASIPLYLITS